MDTLLRRQLEAHEDENRRLKSRFQSENNQLKEMLLQLTDELSKLQSRLREQSPNRQRSTPQTSSAQSEVTASPTQQMEPTTEWPTRVQSIDHQTQCEAVEKLDVSTQCDIIGTLYAASTHCDTLSTPSRPVLPGYGLVSSPSSLTEDSDAPSLAREADRLLSVITRLRAERNTPQSIGKR